MIYTYTDIIDYSDDDVKSLLKYMIKKCKNTSERKGFDLLIECVGNYDSLEHIRRLSKKCMININIDDDDGGSPKIIYRLNENFESAYKQVLEILHKIKSNTQYNHLLGEYVISCSSCGKYHLCDQTDKTIIKVVDNDNYTLKFCSQHCLNQYPKEWF